MERLKRHNYSLMVLQAIAIIYGFLGAFIIYLAALGLCQIPSGNMVILLLCIFVTVLMLVLGTYFIVLSYLMFRGISFAAIKPFSFVLAFLLWFFLERFFDPISKCLGGKNLTLPQSIAVFTPLFLAIIVYFICKKVLGKLAKNARQLINEVGEDEQLKS